MWERQTCSQIRKSLRLKLKVEFVKVQHDQFPHNEHKIQNARLPVGWTQSLGHFRGRLLKNVISYDRQHEGMIEITITHWFGAGLALNKVKFEGFIPILLSHVDQLPSALSDDVWSDFPWS